tara:strand:- start:2807 stop:4018 length:1212 start_codon:yes stop_codon:yes gene_type:complete
VTYALGFYLSLLLTGWNSTEGVQRQRLGLRRWLILCLFWPLFILLQVINAICLYLDNWLFPGYRQVVVRQPVFVVGMPRSGTTFLHHLLALDEDRFTTTVLWELIFAPSIVQRRFWDGLGRLDALIGRPLGRVVYGAERLLLTWLDDVHKTGLQAPEEDFLGLLPAGGCFLLVLLFPRQQFWHLAHFDRDLPAEEQARILGFYRRLVQRHLYCRGADKTYLSKNPSFSPMVAGLARTFPDARFIACFRNPTDAVPSQVSSMLNVAVAMDPRADTSYWREHLTELMQFYCHHLLQVLPALPPAQQALVTMEALSLSPLATLEQLYQRLQLPLSDAYRRALAPEVERARHYRSRHDYSLGGLGFSPQRLLSAFGFVYLRFGYPPPRRLQDRDSHSFVTESAYNGR